MRTILHCPAASFCDTFGKLLDFGELPRASKKMMALY